MKPVLFEFGSFTVHAYGLMIVIGAYFAYLFLSTAANKQFGSQETDGKIKNLQISSRCEVRKIAGFNYPFGGFSARILGDFRN